MAAETGMGRHIRASALHHYSFIWSCQGCRGCGRPTVAFFPAGEFKPDKAGPFRFNGLSCRSWRWRGKTDNSSFFVLLFCLCCLTFSFCPTRHCVHLSWRKIKRGLCGELHCPAIKENLKNEKKSSPNTRFSFFQRSAGLGACVNICGLTFVTKLMLNAAVCN